MRLQHRNTVAAAVVACLAPVVATADGKQPKPPPVNLKITSPAYASGKPLGVMYESGTALLFEAVIRGPTLGIATNRLSVYIGDSDTGWIVFADPDNCLEIALNAISNAPIEFQRECLAALYPNIPPGSSDMSSIVPDETYLQFSNDRDQPGVSDFSSGPLSNPLLSGEPEFMVLTRDFKGGLMGFPDPPAPVSTPLGPFTGGTANDGFGYGADDDFPGLVVLSSRGVGLVYEDADADPNTKTSNFTLVSPRTQWNLAGFLHTVSYELKSNNGKTVIHAGMTLPNGLIAPLISLDNCIGQYDGGFCDVDEHRFRIDGGPLQSGFGGRTAHEFWSAFIPSLTYEIRAFIVSGTAPSQLADLNGDGKVTVADAKIAGYKVLSNEAVTRFRQVSGFICAPENNMTTLFGFDHDGNGQAQIGIVCPPGPGALRPIP